MIRLIKHKMFNYLDMFVFITSPSEHLSSLKVIYCNVWLIIQAEGLRSETNIWLPYFTYFIMQRSSPSKI